MSWLSNTWAGSAKSAGVREGREVRSNPRDWDTSQLVVITLIFCLKDGSDDPKNLPL